MWCVAPWCSGGLLSRAAAHRLLQLVHARDISVRVSRQRHAGRPARAGPQETRARAAGARPQARAPRGHAAHRTPVSRRYLRYLHAVQNVRTYNIVTL